MQEIIAKNILYNGITTRLVVASKLGWNLVPYISVSSLSLKVVKGESLEKGMAALPSIPT